MPRKISINFEGVESGGGRPHVPEGDYGLKIVKIETKKGNDSGEPYLKFHFKLIKGDKKGVGKVITHNCTLQKQGLFNLRNLLEACGKQIPSKAVKIDLDNLVGLECAGTAVDEQYNNKTHSVLSVFFPMEDLASVNGKKTKKDEDDLEAGEDEPAEEPGEDEAEELFS